MPEGIGYGKNSREEKRQAFISAMKSGIKAGVKPEPEPKKKTSKLKRRIKELIGGSKTYMPKSEKHKTTRTGAVESGLAKAGVTQKETAKLRRKK